MSHWHDTLLVILLVLLWIQLWFRISSAKPLKKTHAHTFFHRKADPQQHLIRQRCKPDWVIVELIKLKALLPKAGCRTLALTFNRRFADCGETVGKTFVAQTLQKYRYEIHKQQRNIKNRPAYPVPKGKYWGIDLTQVTDTHKNQHTLMGICEHHSRVAITLKRIEDDVQLDKQLPTFCWWYNQVRPHQSLGGRTPAEVWLGVEPPKTSNWNYVSLWHGALRGIYAPPT